ncbi:MAG: hypothetical protein IJF00_03075 [Bacteroidaceae bacterium]|nr:hypothetical protein [Bacteroidaceae bacterium]MBQ3122502.1 hypothetical protein [Bacteroidaceae bacterium]
MKRILLLCVFAAVLLTDTTAARWNRETKDWSLNPRPVIGDWGFNRPGYPKGLYIHGVTVKEGKKVNNPIIYDNDVYDDVFEDEWMYAMASLKKMKIAALIVTPVLTDGWVFLHPDWIKTAYESRDSALRSGIKEKYLPQITVGTEAESEKAGERKLSDGAHLYVKIINEQYKKNPDRPVIINIGGQAATLASAYCIDPSIVDKCIVYYTDVRVYNGHYEWASKLVAKNFRVVSWGDDNWWRGKRAQNEWNVLPRPANALARDNDENSGEWKLLTEMKKPMLDHMVHQFRNRGEYSNDKTRWYADGYHDGAFIHAWLPGIFSDAELRDVRGEGTEALHVTSFTEENEAAVKKFTMDILLNPKVYNCK